MMAGLVTLCACLAARFVHAIQFNCFSESATSFCIVSDLFVAFVCLLMSCFVHKFLLCFAV